jgi:hypothetical protein
MFVFSFWWKVPKGYMALELFFVSARTIKRHHHQAAFLLSLLKPQYEFFAKLPRRLTNSV